MQEQTPKEPAGDGLAGRKGISGVSPGLIRLLHQGSVTTEFYSVSSGALTAWPEETGV